MSKNISIAEGGAARQFTNDKLKINLVGGGTEYYVPESSVQLTTKSVTANGTYKASDVGEYGFSQFSVNVRGSAGSAGSDGKPNTSGSTKPGGVGSAVVGTDPETGNDVAVGVDSNGNLVQTPVPSGIEIVTEPTKTSYVYQETMDYTGIVVAAKKKDGTTFTDARYMNGHIPMQELIFPVTEAPAGSGNSAIANVYSAGTEMATWHTTGWPYPRAVVKVNDGDAYCALVWGGGYLAPVVVATSEAAATVTVLQHWGGYGGIPEGTPDDVNGPYSPGLYKGLYVYNGYGTKGSIISTSIPVYDGTLDDLIADISSGNTGSTATIPVKWNNPYTGDTHQDTFQIISTPSSGSSSTTTGSSGTEGSGGGGSF